MELSFITDYINEKIFEDDNFIRITFYELRIRCNLSEEETEEFLALVKIRLENLNYKVYFTDESYTYKGINKVVQDNELLIAIKNKE